MNHFSDQERSQKLNMSKLRMDQCWRRKEIGDSTYLRSLFIMEYLPDEARTELNLLKMEDPIERIKKGKQLEMGIGL